MLPGGLCVNHMFYKLCQDMVYEKGNKTEAKAAPNGAAFVCFGSLDSHEIEFAIWFTC